MNKEVLEKYHRMNQITYTVEVLLTKTTSHYEDGVPITEDYSEITEVTTPRGIDHIHQLLTPKYQNETTRYRGFEWTETNTLKKFLHATKFNRKDNHPNIRRLNRAMEKLRVSEDLQVDIMSFFLYDHESE